MSDLTNDMGFGDLPDRKREKLATLFQLLQDGPSEGTIKKAGNLLDEFGKFSDDESNVDMNEAEVWIDSLIGILEEDE